MNGNTDEEVMKKPGIFAMGLLVLAACSSDKDSNTSSSSGSGTSSGYTDHSSAYPTCDQIIKACHPYDIGEGFIHDCHDQGHGAKSDADCTPVKDRCLDACNAAAVDAGVDAAPAQ